MLDKSKFNSKLSLCSVLFVSMASISSVVEASCVVVFPTPPTGYKSVVIQNDAVCAVLLPKK